ncbi:hypothetical protein NHF46_23735 [Arthrobacter alpinus]|nr:hypothetical protein [Arthrobacter alpinus]
MLFLFGVYAFWNTVAGAMGIFMPRIYESIGGLNAIQANLLQVALWSCTALATYFGFMRLADKYSRRLLYGIGAALGIIAWLLLVFAPHVPLVLGAFVVLWGVSAGIGAQAFMACGPANCSRLATAPEHKASCSLLPAQRLVY